MGKLFGDDWKLFKKGGWNMILFEIAYKMIATAIVYPMVIFVTNLIIKIAGVRYLTNNYITKLFTNPFVIFLFLAFLLVISVYVLFEMIFISSCYQYKKKSGRLTIIELYHIAIKIFYKVCKKKSWAIAPFTLLTAFAINIVIMINMVISGPFNNLWITFFSKYTWQAWVLLLLLLLVIYIPVIFGCFTLNIFILEGKNFKESYSKSFSIVKHNFLRVIWTLFIYNVSIILIILVLYIILSAILIAGVKILDMAYIGNAVYLSALRIFRSGIKVCLLYISVPASFTIVTRMYYKFCKDRNTAINFRLFREKNPRRNNIILVGFMVVSILLNSFYVVMTFNKNPFDKVAILSEIKVTAHRGSSLEAPENTLAAFQKAIDDMADYIELDVQETQDGAIIVMHDSNVQRTTGVNKYVWEMTLPEIKQLDAGSSFSPDFAGEKVPTLDQVINLVKGKTKLNIEIKPSGHDKDLSKRVVQILQDNDFVDDCVITSFNYNTLREVKKLDNNIEVGYILSVAYGNFYNMDDVDFFSVNASFLTKITVDSIHNSGKQVYAWTVNNAASIKNLANKGVDNIITDLPISAKEVLYSRNTSETLINMIKYVFNN